MYRYRRDCDTQKEEVKRLRQDCSVAWRESDERKQEIERLQRRAEKLVQFEAELPGVQEANQSLRQEIETVQAQYESIMAEREELEQQNRETMMALNEEREEKTQLEIKLREDELRSPVTPSWAAEKEALNATSPTGRNNLNNHNSSFSFPPVSPTHAGKAHSTPVKAPVRPSLLSELQKTLSADISQPELESLQRKLIEAEEAVVELTREKASLEERVVSLAHQQSEYGTDSARMKDDYTKKLSERARSMENVKEDLLIKEEILGQLRNKLSSMTAERTSMEIEVDGMKNEIKRVQETSAAEIEHCQNDYYQEQEKNLELRGQVTILEDQTTHLVESLQKLESIIYHSHHELSSMTDDIHNMHKAVVSLVTDNKVGSSGAKHRSIEGSSSSREVISARGEAGAETAPADPQAGMFYTLELKDRKSTVQVHQESQSLIGIAHLHNQLRSIRSPLEQFTKLMLERSLAHSTKHLPATESKNRAEERSSPAIGRKNIHDSDSALIKWRAKLAVKTEEVNNLRAIMKARATTTEVSISSLRSKLEGQARAYQTELTRLKHQLRMLRKEKEEQMSQRGMYFKRCEDLTDEVTRLKREMEGMRQDNAEMLTSLKKTIQRKLDLSRELEEYKMEQERMKIIPKLLGSSRI